jgi:hypothetical protein
MGGKALGFDVAIAGIGKFLLSATCSDHSFFWVVKGL